MNERHPRRSVTGVPRIHRERIFRYRPRKTEAAIFFSFFVHRAQSFIRLKKVYSIMSDGQSYRTSIVDHLTRQSAKFKEIQELRRLTKAAPVILAGPKNKKALSKHRNQNNATWTNRQKKNGKTWKTRSYIIYPLCVATRSDNDTKYYLSVNFSENFYGKDGRRKFMNKRRLDLLFLFSEIIERSSKKTSACPPRTRLLLQDYFAVTSSERKALKYYGMLWYSSGFASREIFNSPSLEKIGSKKDKTSLSLFLSPRKDHGMDGIGSSDFNPATLHIVSTCKCKSRIRNNFAETRYWTTAAATGQAPFKTLI